MTSEREVDWVSGQGWKAHTQPLTAFANRDWTCVRALGDGADCAHHDHIPGKPKPDAMEKDWS